MITYLQNTLSETSRRESCRRVDKGNTKKDLSRLISGIRASDRRGRRNGGEMKMDVGKSIKESREVLSRGISKVWSVMSRGKRPRVLGASWFGFSEP